MLERLWPKSARKACRKDRKREARALKKAATRAAALSRLWLVERCRRCGACKGVR